MEKLRQARELHREEREKERKIERARKEKEPLKKLKES